MAQAVWDDWKFSLVGNQGLSPTMWNSVKFWQAGSADANYVPSYSTYVDQKCVNET
jgi:hypothetical protein